MLHRGITDDFHVPILGDGLDYLVQKNIPYKEQLRQSLSAKLEEEVDFLDQKLRPLSVTDKLIVQAALDHANAGSSVAVASADRGIIYQLNRLWYEDNIEMNVHSPWAVPRKIEEIKILISGNVFGQLYESRPQDEIYKKYLAVAKHKDIGGSVHYDIAFDIYTNKSLTVQFPNLMNVYFIPMFFAHFDGEKLKNWYSFYDLLTLKIAGVYNRQLSLDIWLPEWKHTISHPEKKNLMIRHKNGQLTKKEKEFLNNWVKEEKDIIWARIEDQHIKEHNKITAGELESLRYEIKKYA